MIFFGVAILLCPPRVHTIWLLHAADVSRFQRLVPQLLLILRADGLILNYVYGLNRNHSVHAFDRQ